MKEKYIIKIIVVGEAGIGKTTLSNYYVNKEIKKKNEPTIGIEYYTKEIELENKIIKLNIWDTAGQEEYGKITKLYYRGANVVLLCYSVKKRKTYERLKRHEKEIEEICPKKIKKILVGTCIDGGEEEREVTREEAEEYSKEIKYEYEEVSTYDEKNIKEMFEKIIKEMDKEIEKEEENNYIEIKINKKEMKKKEKKRCCNN